MTNELVDRYFADIYEEILRSLEAKKGGPFGAGVVINDELVALGTNEVLATTDVSRHAEVVTLSKATKKLDSFHLKGGVLLSSHLPCLMCYHAVKWALIGKVYYVYTYEETQNLFSFFGDSNFLHDLGLESDFCHNDPGIEYVHYSSPKIQELYFEKLPKIWKEKYEAELTAYDVSKA